MKDFLYQQSRNSDSAQAAIADNCRFDERASAERWQGFLEKLPKPDAYDWADWSEANTLHYQQLVTVPKISVPVAFLDINQNAWLTGIATNRPVVRIEVITDLLKSLDVDEKKSFNTLQKLMDSTEPDDKQQLKEKIEYWNKARDARPCFAAFYDEVKDEADSTDWQHALSERLGLAHLRKIPVALMRYSLDIVPQDKAPCAFALPTVLDGGMNEYFFPTPKGHAYGATLHLGPEQAQCLTAEILHYRIDYQREHLQKIAWIDRPKQLDDHKLRKARDAHLTILRAETERADFGEYLEGRI